MDSNPEIKNLLYFPKKDNKLAFELFLGNYDINSVKIFEVKD